MAGVLDTLALALDALILTSNMDSMYVSVPPPPTQKLIASNKSLSKKNQVTDNSGTLLVKCINVA
jgi:hypothetical protein